MYLISAITLGAEIREEETEYRDLCDKNVTTAWNLGPLESWVATADLEANKKDKIQELIELLREHKAE